jgi:RimJ/RimL family protein N-acetyltransferase
MEVTLCTPLPRSWWPLVWTWLQEDLSANCDDTGPQTAEAFELEMGLRAHHEQTWGVLADDVPCGAIAVRLLTPRLAQTHGVVFTQAVHGLGVARDALMSVLQVLWSQGVEKVSATYFADNVKIRRCLAALGAVDEGLLRSHTVRAGVPIDLQMVAFFSQEK